MGEATLPVPGGNGGRGKIGEEAKAWPTANAANVVPNTTLRKVIEAESMRVRSLSAKNTLHRKSNPKWSERLPQK